jgi:hypothetical protein
MELIMDKNKLLTPVNIRPDILLDVDKMDLKELSEDDLIELGRGVTEVNTYSQWILGKLVNEVAQRRGDIEDYANKIGQRRDKLYQILYVFRKFTKEVPNFNPSDYYGAVPWGMLQYVASKSEEPVKLLNELIDEGVISQPAAIRKVKEKETGTIIPPRPRVNFKWNEAKGQWTIKFRLDEMPLIDWEEARDDVLGAFKKTL